MKVHRKFLPSAVSSSACGGGGGGGGSSLPIQVAIEPLPTAIQVGTQQAFPPRSPTTGALPG